MNKDMERLCRAAQNAQPAELGAPLRTEDVVRAILAEAANPTSDIAAGMVARVIDRIGREAALANPDTAGVAVSGYLGGLEAFFREDD